MSYAHILGTMYERSSYYDKGFIIDELMLYHIIYDLYHDPYQGSCFWSELDRAAVNFGGLFGPFVIVKRPLECV